MSHLVIQDTEFGAAHYIPKPYDNLHKLAETIRRHLLIDDTSEMTRYENGPLDRAPHNKIIGSSPQTVEVFKMTGRVYGTARNTAGERAIWPRKREHVPIW